MDDNLTPKQQLFVESYISNGLNATQAARQAGYNGDDGTIRAIASQNLTKLNVKAAVEREQAKLRAQFTERRAGLLADVDEVKAEIDAVKAEFADNANIRSQLIARRLEAIDKEAKLTGAYIKDAANPADIQATAENIIARMMADGYSREQVIVGLVKEDAKYKFLEAELASQEVQ